MTAERDTRKGGKNKPEMTPVEEDAKEEAAQEWRDWVEMTTDIGGEA